MDIQEKLKKIVKVLDSKKAEDIEVLGIRDLTVLSDYFVIANGTSTTHTRTLADEVEFQLSQEGIKQGLTSRSRNSKVHCFCSFVLFSSQL